MSQDIVISNILYLNKHFFFFFVSFLSTSSHFHPMLMCHVLTGMELPNQINKNLILKLQSCMNMLSQVNLLTPATFSLYHYFIVLGLSLHIFLTARDY